MQPDQFTFEKGYDNPVKFNWLVGELELNILQEWKPEHVTSNSTVLRIETEDESIPEYAYKIIEELTTNKGKFLREIEHQILKYYITELYPEILDELEWLKSNDQERYKAHLKQFPKYTMKDIDCVKSNNFLSEIYIPLQKSEGTFGISFDSKWEEEHGIGITFRNYEFLEAGPAEIVSDLVSLERETIMQEQLKNGVVFPSPPPIYKYLKDLDYVVHWEWNHKLNRYYVVKKMKDEFSAHEVEIK